MIRSAHRRIAGADPLQTAAQGTGARRERAFGRAHRMRTRAQLAFVRRHGRTLRGRLSVVTGSAPADGCRRVAVVVSRRYSRLAVVRNRARRLLRESYRQLLPTLAPAWLLLAPRQRMQTAKLAPVLDELRRLTGELGFAAAAAAPEAAGAQGPEQPVRACEGGCTA